ncbi:carboxylating nicotinate-nucleotide diphosphorylase [Polynucleobacter bastaniensis]|jgi:nicotinate-nucleotide pyrophosphorylase (carboxylating)|uniref:carboxylating nicotinate-nucleotide diphosphorylase n=1 Tax=Polynucleobacter bastaniensis TaxID=2081039 RepID=UPI001C0C602A|nr:carboxylating nicotinate-nucleotide diphosphorylase [Polynucleobacter bastaniensis]MBU3598675.1 carboxylating nicotinate-nucleotide diphosphorylase [Polynucleobacter bastaniensis]
MFDYNETLEQARQRNIADALMEDIGKCDWTAQLVPSKPVHAQLIVRQEAVLCGVDWFEGTLKKLDPIAKVNWYYREGDLMKPDTKVCDIEANSRALLSAERPCINFLQTLSWTASSARQYVDAIAGVSPNPNGCAVLDTRKTIPGLRQAQKYAVRVGGGQNQRLALWHGILIKENHIAAAGGVAAAVKAAQALNSGVDIQVEVENFTELKEALGAGAKNILIDNFTTDQMKEAVAFTNGRALLEASGGIDLDQIRAIAATGVDRISLGILTKDIKAVDFSMRIL